ncbi:MAG: hypothetical protein HN350_08920 [Phycisphaerales bacterium]|jgi:hypothetical protein|nr:hypothetical protein [Phycisphaerales bacterium]
MFEYHGWVTIHDGCSEEQDDNTLLSDSVKQIRGAVDQLDVNGFGCRVELAESNGLHHLTMHGHRNHSQQWPLELFETAGRIAKGSYGVLYIHNDEDIDFSNEFQTWVMTRGKVTKRTDQFLSPCIPTLEG